LLTRGFYSAIPIVSEKSYNLTDLMNPHPFRNIALVAVFGLTLSTEAGAAILRITGNQPL